MWPTRKIKNNISNTNNNGKIWAHKHIYRRTHTWTHKSHHHLKRKRFFSYSDQQHKNLKIIFFFVFHVFSIAQTEIDIENHLEIDLKYKFGQANIQQLGQFSFWINALYEHSYIHSLPTYFHSFKKYFYSSHFTAL